MFHAPLKQTSLFRHLIASIPSMQNQAAPTAASTKVLARHSRPGEHAPELLDPVSPTRCANSFLEKKDAHPSTAKWAQALAVNFPSEPQ